MTNQPRYVDLQINGYAGVDFNRDNLSDADLHLACELLRADGVGGVLATVITDELPRMMARLERIAAIRQREPLVREMIWGIHVEGPFINETPGYVGAHPPQAVRPANVEDMKRLLEAAGGLTRLVTLAPERDTGLKVVRHLAQQGILIAAGHTNASLDELQGAIDAGLSLFTHLGNGCPPLLPRHDNIIQRVLSLRDRLTPCFIGDGVHVPLAALGNYLRLVGVERAVVVSDAISAARLKPGRYTVGAQTVDIGEDMVARSPDNSHLFGSTATMPQIASLLREELGLSPTDVKRLLFDNPRAVLARTVATPVGC
jgi:N-acetylglucosamine-6-phosphate deacetylase